MKFTVSALLTILVSLSATGQTVADLILVNGHIRTMDSQNPRAEAMAITDGRIISVGKSTDIKKLAGAKTQVIDARGRLVIPGFNDSHVHFTGIGNQFSHLDTREIRNGEDLIKKISFFVRFLPKGYWIIGSGLTLETIKNLPTLEQIDEIAPGNPLLIYSLGYKSALTNSAAIGLARIKESKSIVSEAEISRIRHQVPADHGRNWREIIETATNYAASLGVTSVQDVHTDDLLSDLRFLENNGKLKTRVYECVGIKDRLIMAEAGVLAASGSGMVRGGCVKGLADGSREEVGELQTVITEADKLGLQVMIHAIGQRAISGAVDAFEFAAKTNGERDRRFRVEHASRIRVDDYSRFVRTGVIASMQPHLFYSGAWSGGDDYRTILKAGVRIAFGSDASMTDFNPLLGIYAAVNSGQQSISVEQAVAAYTIGSAFAEFQENSKGTLSIGKYADFVVLSDDIFSIDKRKIDNCIPLLTVVNGAVVFRDERF